MIARLVALLFPALAPVKTPDPYAARAHADRGRTRYPGCERGRVGCLDQNCGCVGLRPSRAFLVARERYLRENFTLAELSNYPRALDDQRSAQTPGCVRGLTGCSTACFARLSDAFLPGYDACSPLDADEGFVEARVRLLAARAGREQATP